MRQILPRKLVTEADVEAGAHKELFLRYYQPLFRLALRLTDGSRPLAEDLLHDAFIHFVLSHPDLNSIDNFDRYLHRLLVNLFRTQKRKAAQMQDISFNIADYDSANLGLHAIDFQARWQVQEDLVRICHYACVRKETSRAGSVLILRFFYDYSPSEIARVTLSPRGAVDDWLRLARREARFYLEDPERLKFMAGKQRESYRFKTKSIKLSDDIVYELRASILRSGRSECLPEAQLLALYQDGGQAEKTIDCATLGHIVSCAGCLDRVNHLLGLPSLSARQAIEKGRSDPDEPDESDKGDAGGTGLGSRPSKAFIDRCEEQIRQIREHRPEELLFSANGDPIGALKINSDLSELRLSIHGQSPVEFIEVYSERGMRLILFSLELGEDAPMEQQAKIELSEGRTLELIFRLGGSSPSLQVIYRDPPLQEIDHALNDEPIGVLALVCDAGPLSEGVGSLRLEAGADVAAHTADVGSEGLITWLSRRLRGLRLRRRRSSRLTMLSISTESQAVHSEPTAQTATELANVPGSEDPRFKELRVFKLGSAEDLIRGPLCARPGFITALFSVLLVGALLYLWMPGGNPVTAAGLLERAKTREGEIDRNPNLFRHRLLDLEERQPDDGRLISRHRIEEWHSAARGVRVRRLYDGKNRLIAGEWRTIGATKVLYRNQRAKALDQKTATPPPLMIRGLEVWRQDMSATEFSALIKQSDRARVDETPQGYVIEYQAPASGIGNSSIELVMASLTLRRDDLHVLEQRLIVEHAGQQREFRFTELKYEQPAAHTVSPAMFDPDAELLGATADNISEGKKGETFTLRSAEPERPPLIASADLEVEAAYLLSVVKADLGEQISLERTVEGRLRIAGIVGTEVRKAEILRGLSSLINNPAVEVDISTEDEALRHQAQRATSGPVVVREITVSSNEMPAYQSLRRYFIAKFEEKAAADEKSSADRIDREIREFTTQVLRRSGKALEHASALRRLVNHIPPDKVRTLTSDARSKWDLMVREHARACRLEIKALRQTLEPVFFPQAAIEKENGKSEIIDDVNLDRIAEELLVLCRANDVVTSAAFTISNKTARISEFATLRFWQSLREAEAFASSIEQNEQHNFGKNGQQAQP
jgi:DNA-directed RNA polymerase specialized sigma24 family protein